MRNNHSKLISFIIPLWLITACADDNYFKKYDLPVSDDVATMPYLRLVDMPSVPTEIESSEQNDGNIQAEILKSAKSAKARMATTSTIIDAEFIQKKITAQKRRSVK